MKSIYKNIILCLVIAGLLIGSSIAFKPGTQRGIQNVVSIHNTPDGSLASHKSPASPKQHHFSPSKKLNITQRLDLPSKAMLALRPIPLHFEFVYLPANPPDRKFAKGTFHRYRPRDPTKA